MKRILKECTEGNAVIEYATGPRPFDLSAEAHRLTGEAVGTATSGDMPEHSDCSFGPRDMRRPADRDFPLMEMLEDNLTAAEMSMGIDTLMPREDFTEACLRYTTERFGPECEKDMRSVLETGLLATADHLGGFYSPQSFQGDLMYAMTMRNSGRKLRYVPIFSFGMITVQNSAFPRGMMAFQGLDAPARCSMIPRKYANSMICGMNGYTPAMLDNMRKNLRNSGMPSELKELSLKLTDDIYGSPDVLSKERYAEQLVKVGFDLTDGISDDLPGFIFIENEELFRVLVADELDDPGSLIYRALNSPELTREFIEHRSGNGWKTFGQSLFMGVDSKGRNFILTLGEDGSFTGKDWEDETVLIRKNEIRSSLEERRIIPTVYLMAVVSAFERGFTWCGGTFQAVYLPRLRHRTVKMLRNAAKNGAADGEYLIHMAEMMEPYNCERYTSGPIFALVDGGNRTLGNASLLEFLLRKPSAEELKKMMMVSIADAHIMGMYEYYNDIVPTAEKMQGWYEVLTGYLYEKYRDFRI